MLLSFSRLLIATIQLMQSVVEGQAPISLESLWRKYLGSKTEAKTKNKHNTHSTREAKRTLADKPLKREDEAKQNKKKEADSKTQKSKTEHTNRDTKRYKRGRTQH